MTGLARAFLIAAICALALALVPESARADGDTAACRIFEIRASNDEGPIDRDLKPLERKLKRPPFSSWKKFELLKRQDRTLARNTSVNLKLVPGGRLSLLFRDLTREQGKKPRLRLTFTLDDKGGKRKLDGTINLDSGDHYLIGGDELADGGTYILAIGCQAK
jgi:hypothetical protein